MIKKRKIIAAINVVMFGLFVTAFLFKALILAAILLAAFSVVFVFTVQS